MEFKICPNDGNKLTIREGEPREGATWELGGNWLRESEGWEGPPSIDLKDGKGKIAPITKKGNVFFGSPTNVTLKELALKSPLGHSHQTLRTSNHTPTTMVMHLMHFGYGKSFITRWISYWLWTLIWGHKHVKVGQLDDPCSKNKSWWKIDFENLNVKTFTNVINFGVY
jgi:hypothetical protein